MDQSARRDTHRVARRLAGAFIAFSVAAFPVAALPGTAAAVPPPSPNQVFWEDDNHLVFQGGISKTNQLVVTNWFGPNGFFFDDVTSIVPGVGCQNVPGDNTKAICTVQDDTISWFEINLGMGNDTMTLDAEFDTYVYVRGGTGNDAITIGPAAGPYVDVKGEGGADTVTRTSGTSYLRVDGGDGPDSICATDAFVFYTNHTAGVYASIGGPAGGDGVPGEGDTICATVRSITGTPYADTLVAGNARANLSGGNGNDLIVGSPANDGLFGDAGNDTIYGAQGDDMIWGGYGADTVYAGTDVDQCQVDGGDGITDTIHECETLF